MAAPIVPIVNSSELPDVGLAGNTHRYNCIASIIVSLDVRILTP